MGGFKVFRWIDFLTFGLAAMLASSLAVWATAAPNPLVGRLITVAMALGFVGIYGVLLARRIAFAKRIAYQTIHGLVVMRSPQTPAQQALELETERVEAVWEMAIRAEKADRRLIRRAFAGVVVEWKTAPFAMSLRPGFRWMGLTSGTGRLVQVGRIDPLEKSALGHELGHVILMAWKDDGSEEALKVMSDKYGVPY